MVSGGEPWDRAKVRIRSRVCHESGSELPSMLPPVMSMNTSATIGSASGILRSRIEEEEEKQKAQYRRWALDDLMKRYPREKIYEEIWAEPMIKVAKRYNVSDVALAKVRRKLNIPRPGRGYWEKKAAGKPASTRPALPVLN